MNISSPIALRPVYHRGRWLTAWCSYTEAPFGGLFTEAEAAYLLRATSGLAYALSPAEFGEFVAAALRWCRDNPTSTTGMNYEFAT